MNFNLNLDHEKMELLNKLETNNRKVSKDLLIEGILNGENTWEDYEDLQYCLELEKNKSKSLTSEEANNYLKNLFLNKHSHDFQP